MVWVKGKGALREHTKHDKNAGMEQLDQKESMARARGKPKLAASL